jgi:hypothetical protein
MKTAELKEKVAKDALENFDWPKLKNHLDDNRDVLDMELVYGGGWG